MQAFQNDHIETTKDKNLLAFKPLISGDKKSSWILK